ncbi:mechanosensitive ion channel family protein [Agriterribacter sp.]|uniref:mechanosensitive ion channel family protein n=1 Tax=Agriterribacter sp. TaxID=2821509 RepID=UPI002CA0D15A|nr:mechanosensitive ion channel family protein [Agriterribacter sp.]HRO46366.1 mechanosensitive ion channel family protein [Agriterribacter sp.]HRQ18553.1 mechanosensitive ion channel family protein [Agriterribacter sp.]
MTFDELLYFSLFVAGGLIAGFFVKKVISPVFKRVAGRTKWSADDLILESVSKWMVPWFVALGVFLGWRRVEMDAKYHHWLENGLMIFYVFSVTWIAANVLSGMTKVRSAHGDNVVASSSIIGNIIKVIVYCIGILVILQSLGISITPALTALGVGGLAVALALQDTLSNLFAGIQIVSTRKINPGDFIRLESGQDGFVEDISWRYTTLKTGANNTVIIPNSKLASAILSNYFYPNKEAVFDVAVGVDYNSDLEKVERITVEVLKEVQRASADCVQDFEPFIRFQQFGESSIDLKAFLKAKTFGSQFLIKHELIKRLRKRYKEEGINIPFPVRSVFVNKPYGE